jgi:hypothetical protein
MLALMLPSATSCRLWGRGGSLAGAAPAGGTHHNRRQQWQQQGRRGRGQCMGFVGGEGMKSSRQCKLLFVNRLK